jgi:hypothetical protein
MAFVHRQQAFVVRDHRPRGIPECLSVHLVEAYAKAPRERMGYNPTAGDNFQPQIDADER